MKTKVYSQDNVEVGEMDLEDRVFSVRVKPEILHQAVRSHLAASRQGTVGVKTRGLIRGGGSKPWRQKGTGRARVGSSRSPLWTGGAVTHGPKQRDHGFKLNKKVRRLALKMALSARAADGSLKVVDGFKLDEVKTKKFVQIKDNLEAKKPLIVISKEYNNLELSARNVPGVEVVTSDRVNPYLIMKHGELIMEQEAVNSLQDRLS
ncbi:MAG: 50S ribosomal protein L4 [Desulfonatronovibrionaceae bacterium]